MNIFGKDYLSVIPRGAKLVIKMLCFTRKTQASQRPLLQHIQIKWLFKESRYPLLLEHLRGARRVNSIYFLNSRRVMFLYGISLEQQEEYYLEPQPVHKHLPHYAANPALDITRPAAPSSTINKPRFLAPQIFAAPDTLPTTYPSTQFTTSIQAAAVQQSNGINTPPYVADNPQHPQDQGQWMSRPYGGHG